MRTKGLPIPLRHQAPRPRSGAVPALLRTTSGGIAVLEYGPPEIIPSLDLMLAGHCASLPTAPPAPARTPAENGNFLTSGGDFRRETDCLLERDGFEPSVPGTKEPVF